MGLALVNIWCPDTSAQSRWGWTGGLYHKCTGKGQAGQWCMCKCIERGTWIFEKHLTPWSSPWSKYGLCFTFHPYTGFPSKRTYCTLQRRTICWISFHFTPSICLMNNNEFEGFTGSQHSAEICINRFSDLARLWFCLDHLPLACPCMANFYTSKLSQPFRFPIESRNK